MVFYGYPSILLSHWLKLSTNETKLELNVISPGSKVIAELSFHTVLRTCCS